MFSCGSTRCAPAASKSIPSFGRMSEVPTRISLGSRHFSATHEFEGTKWNHSVSEITEIAAVWPSFERSS